MFRLARRLISFVVVAGVIYGGVTFGQVVLASRRDGARPADAIVVFGAAQYNGKPSAVLRARLDHALALYRRHLAPTVVVTGGRQTGDAFTEASTSANYLLARGIPDNAILREVKGTDSWNSLAAAANELRRRNKTSVVLVSDPFHSARIAAMAKELGLRAAVSPTRTSPIRGRAELGYLVRETGAVAGGRIVGFRRLARVRHEVAVGYSEAAHSGVV